MERLAYIKESMEAILSECKRVDGNRGHHFLIDHITLCQDRGNGLFILYTPGDAVVYRTATGYELKLIVDSIRPSASFGTADDILRLPTNTFSPSKHDIYSVRFDPDGFHDFNTRYNSFNEFSDSLSVYCHPDDRIAELISRYQEIR